MKLISIVRILSLALVGLPLWTNAACVCKPKPVKPPKPAKPATFAFTQYWLPIQGMDDVDDNGNIIHLTGPATKWLKTCDGQNIAEVDANTYYKFQLEGTGRLTDGRTVNLGANTNCFEVLSPAATWGVGSEDNPLTPYVSVAENDFAIGTLIYIAKLDGLTLPGSTIKHNGCVRVDDKGWSFGSRHIDWMVGTYAYYSVLENQLPESVRAIVHANCTILSYL